MQGFSDERLVQIYKEGNHNALAVLIARYMDTINIKLKMCKISNHDVEDAKQEILISFLNIVNSYDYKRNIKFKTYANRCLDNAIKNYLNKIFTKKSVADRSFLELDENTDISVINSYNENPVDIYEDKVSYDELMKMIKLQLSEFEKNVLFYYLDGKSYAEISTQCNSTEKAVDNALQRIRRKLKTIFKTSNKSF